MLLVLRNVKERNKQYVKSFLFFTKLPNMKYFDRMVLSNIGRILEKDCKGVYCFIEAADEKLTALLKNKSFTVTFKGFCYKFG